MPTTLITALLAAAAFWAAQRNLRRQQLLLGLVVGAIFYTVLALQLVVSLQRLLPIALPLSTAAAIVGLQRNRGFRP